MALRTDTKSYPVSEYEQQRGSPIGSFNPVIPRVIFGVLPPAHTFNPESRLVFAFKSQIPNPVKPIEDP